MVKRLSAMLEIWVRSLGRENPLEKEMATHSRTLVWKIPWTEKPGRLQSMEFSRQEYWSGLPFPSPGDLPDPGIEPRSPALQTDALPSDPPGKPQTAYILVLLLYPFSQSLSFGWGIQPFYILGNY